MKVKRFKIRIKLMEPMLGTAPSDPEVYSKYIASKKLEDAVVRAMSPDHQKEVQEKTTEEELAMLPPATDETKGVTVFRRNATGLILTDFMARGFLKEAAESVSGTWGIRSKIDKWLHVAERQIPIMRDGVQIKEPDGIFERPLRAMTMQGPRVALAASERVDAPADIEFSCYILPLGEDAKKGKMSLDVVNEWLEYGVLNGFGQWRSGGYGRFAGKGAIDGALNITINDDLTVSSEVTA